MVEFKSIKELKNKVYPVLSIKKKYFSKLGYVVTEDMIFDYLSENKWKKSSDLRFFQIINDIIRLDGDDLIEKK
mgnify:CR=1 FL=1